MKNHSEVFKNIYSETFSLDKIKSDLVLYLKDFGDIKNTSVNIGVYNIDKSISENVSISENDEITITSLKSIFIFNIDFYYEVEIAIGVFKKDIENYYFYTVDKCLAKLKYNEDLSLYDIDFYIRELNRQ